MAGWVAYDSDEHGLAQRYLTQALAYARHADDPALAAEILAAQAHQALYLARPDEAVDLARGAQAAAVRHGSATLLTECLVMEAHGHAARNDAHACGSVLARAEQTEGELGRFLGAQQQVVRGDGDGEAGLHRGGDLHEHLEHRLGQPCGSATDACDTAALIHLSDYQK